MRPLATGLCVFIVALMVTGSDSIFQDFSTIHRYAVSFAMAVFVVGIDIVIRYFKEKRK